MHTLRIKNSSLQGEITAPPSKSHTHRAVIASSLADGSSKIYNPLISQDTLATCQAVTHYGTKIDQKKNFWVIKGHGTIKTPHNIIDCNESAATLRFITAIMPHAEGISVLTGRNGLLKRPMGPLLSSLEHLGVRSYSTKGDNCPPLIVFGGGIKGGDTVIRGDVSSQFISGLLFTAPLAESEITITLSTKLESKPYVDMTLNIIKKHHIHIDVEEYHAFTIPAPQPYLPQNHRVEGDYSSAAFLMAAAASTQSHINIQGLNPSSVQGDRAIIQILKSMAVNINPRENHVTIDGSQGLNEIEIDASDIPDLVPVIAALACLLKKKTIIKNVQRLRLKESDRIASIITEFKKTGAHITYRTGNLYIQGEDLKPAHFYSHNDHRIAMATIILALSIKGESQLTSYECIKKSYPNFIHDLQSLGADIIGI